MHLHDEIANKYFQWAKEELHYRNTDTAAYCMVAWWSLSKSKLSATS